jgi:site-specific DNA-cytosine methylase
MNLLELFAGSRSMGRAAEEQGMDVHSTDLIDFGRIDTVGNILAIPIDYWVAMAPDIIHASPPCTSFSVASIGHHWTGGKGAYIPKTQGALIGLALMHRTLEIIEACRPKVWYIENPRGLMRKMPEMQKLPIRHTVTYCQYGDTRMKPTDIWTNCTEWVPRPMCKNGDPCHESAPRGARTGTQGLKGAHDRSKIPHALCAEMIGAAHFQSLKT